MKIAHSGKFRKIALIGLENVFAFPILAVFFEDLKIFIVKFSELISAVLIYLLNIQNKFQRLGDEIPETDIN